MLAAGADVNVRNRDGETPLLQWALTGKLDLLRCYVEAGADLNATDNNGRTALHRLIERDPPEVEAIALLVDAGADVNHVDHWGWSILDYYIDWLDRKRKDEANADPRYVALFGTRFHTAEITRCIEYITERGARRVFDPHARKKKKNKGAIKGTDT